METHLDAHSTLRIVWGCGTIGLLVDLDHLISLILWRYWFPWITEGRIWHTPLLLLSCIGICCLGTLGRRLHPKYLLSLGVIVVIVTTLILIYSPLVVWGLTK